MYEGEQASNLLHYIDNSNTVDFVVTQDMNQDEFIFIGLGVDCFGDTLIELD